MPTWLDGKHCSKPITVLSVCTAGSTHGSSVGSSRYRFTYHSSSLPAAQSHAELLRARSNLTFTSFLILSFTCSGQYQQASVVKAKNRHQTRETKKTGCTTHRVGCVYHLKDEGTLTCIECVTTTDFISILICFGLFAVTPSCFLLRILSLMFTLWWYIRLYNVAWCPCGSRYHVNHNIRLAWSKTLRNENVSLSSATFSVLFIKDGLRCLHLYIMCIWVCMYCLDVYVLHVCVYTLLKKSGGNT